LLRYLEILGKNLTFQQNKTLDLVRQTDKEGQKKLKALEAKMDAYEGGPSVDDLLLYGK
jgi:hypothetical protein